MNKYRSDQEANKIRYQLAGWLLFVVCALFFITSSVQHHDVLTLIGSFIFLIACIVFIVPVVRSYKQAGMRRNHLDGHNATDANDCGDQQQH